VLQGVRRVSFHPDGRARPVDHRLVYGTSYCRGVVTDTYDGRELRGGEGAKLGEVLDGDHPVPPGVCQHPIIPDRCWRSHAGAIHVWQASQGEIASMSVTSLAYPYQPVARFENVAVRIAFTIDKHFAEKLESVSEIVIRKYAPTYYGRASTVCREWYLSGRRFAYNPEAPATPISAGIPTPGLAPSGSWPNKRGSWMSGSPSTGSMSCASSDAGDESPLTPITPAHTPAIDPFSMASKENIAPGMFASGGDAKDVVYNGKPAMVGLPNAFAHPRPVLQDLPAVGDLAIPHRSMRRLSN